MRKMWSFLLAALALTGCAAAPADALPAAETAEMTATETEETAAQPVGFTVGNLSEVPNTCGGYWGWNTGDAYYEIARLDDENDQESMHALLLKTDYATAVTSEIIARYVRAMQNSFDSDNIKTLHRLVGGRVEALEFNVGPGLPFIGVPLKDLNLREGMLVAGIVRQNGAPVIPSGADALQEGDDVVIVTTDTTLHALRDIVK